MTKFMYVVEGIVRKQRRVITDPQEKHVRLFLESMKVSTGKPTVKIGYEPTRGKTRIPPSGGKPTLPIMENGTQMRSR
jgi:hypothetical protein